jgi:chromosome segregation ATPase
MNRLSVVSLCAVLLPLYSTARAQDAEARARNLAQQLRTITTERDNLRNTQAALEAKNKTLEEQVKKQAENLVKMDEEMKAAKATAETIQKEQIAKITRLEDELAKHKATLDKWQAAHATITDIAKKKEAERAKMSARAAELERRAADYRAKNVELYKLGSEILARYESFGIGEALAAREPFTGNAKVKLQNLVQDYGDKLLEQTARP